jgi:anti-anti-sigma factor
MDDGLIRTDTSWPAPTIATVSVVGELDLGTAPVLERELDRVIKRCPDVVEVDIADLSFMDCAGVTVLISARDAAVAIGCYLRVSHPAPPVAFFLELVRLRQLLDRDWHSTYV